MSYSNQIHQIYPVTNTPAAAVLKVSTSTAAAAKVAAAPTANNAAAGADRADLSSTSKLVAAALTTSDVRLEKVASLQQAIANGTYHVSSGDVADKLVQALIGG